MADKTVEDVDSCVKMRYAMTFLFTTGVTVGFCMRTALSIGIVAMTDKKTNPDFETFDWDSSTQGTILSSFFWGYVISNVPAGLVLQRYGARWVLLLSIGISGLATLLIPVAATNGGWGALCALRVIQGFAQGALFPSQNALLSKWAPLPERGLLGSICYAGIHAGNVITLPVGGLLASGDGGWPSIFYVVGSISLAWCVLWLFFGYSTPADHPWISQDEKFYIESYYDSQSKKASFQTPWKSIVLSRPMWAILVAHCVQNWGFYMLLTEMPTYMSDILNFNIKENGSLAALPYIVMFVLTFVFGWIADALSQRQIVTLVWSRKIFNSMGFLCPMATMVGLSYVGAQEQNLAVALLVLSAGLNAGVYTGFQVNHVDLSPNFAGTLMGITNGISNCISLIVPIAVGAIVTDEHNEEQWHTVFWMSAGIYLCGSLVYLIFGAADIQPWNEDKLKEQDGQAKKLEENKNRNAVEISVIK